MRFAPVVGSLLVLSIAACSDTQPNTKSSTSPPNSSKDNTAVNERDRSATAKTPLDQNENQRDLDITANIRKRIVDTKLSVNAQKM